jgi:hypothetical protein
MMAGNIMILDSIIVEVVEDAQAVLIALTIVGLGTVGSSSV